MRQKLVYCLKTSDGYKCLIFLFIAALVFILFGKHPIRDKLSVLQGETLSILIKKVLSASFTDVCRKFVVHLETFILQTENIYNTAAIVKNLDLEPFADCACWNICRRTVNERTSDYNCRRSMKEDSVCFRKKTEKHKAVP